MKSTKSVKRRALTAVACLGIAASMVSVASPAGATELPNQLGALRCKEVKIAPKSKLQVCSDVFWADGEHTSLNGIADVTAYKKVKVGGQKQWVRDDSVQVSADQNALFVDNVNSSISGYPTGPINGRASISTRIPQGIDRSVAHTTFSKATVGLWQGGVEVRTINVQSNTVTVPAQ